MSADAQAAIPLATYLDQWVEDLRELVPSAIQEFDADAIHRCRVATRRLKAGLDLLRPVLSSEHRRPFGSVLRKLRRRLGPLRDLDVMLGHLEDLKTANRGRHAPAVRWLAARWSDDRTAARAESQDGAGASRVLAKLGAWWGVRQEILEAYGTVDSLMAQSLHQQLDAFATESDRLVGKMPLPANADVQDPHQIRIAGKALRYTLEMAIAQGHPLGKSVTKSFKQMQDCLGLWHDFVVLTERAMRSSLDALLAHHNSVLQRAVLDLAQQTARSAELQLARFSRLWTRRGEQLTASIRGAFPVATGDGESNSIAVDSEPEQEAPVPTTNDRRMKEDEGGAVPANRTVADPPSPEHSSAS